MKRKKREKVPSGYNRHHIIPRSRGGNSKLENIAVVEILGHNNYHYLFKNMKPDEIVEYLVKNYWNGNWAYVEKAYTQRR